MSSCLSRLVIEVFLCWRIATDNPRLLLNKWSECCMCSPLERTGHRFLLSQHSKLCLSILMKSGQKGGTVLWRWELGCNSDLGSCTESSAALHTLVRKMEQADSKSKILRRGWRVRGRRPESKRWPFHCQMKWLLNLNKCTKHKVCTQTHIQI